MRPAKSRTPSILVIASRPKHARLNSFRDSEPAICPRRVHGWVGLLFGRLMSAHAKRRELEDGILRKFPILCGASITAERHLRGAGCRADAERGKFVESNRIERRRRMRPLRNKMFSGAARKMSTSCLDF